MYWKGQARLALACWGLVCCFCGMGLGELGAQVPEREAADLYFKSFLFKDAIPMYERSLQKDDKQAQAWLQLAESYRFTHQFDLAAKAYDKAFSLLPSLRQPEAVIAYLQVLRILGQKALAEQRLKTWLEPADPRRAEQFLKLLRFEWTKEQETLFNIRNVWALNSKHSDFAPTFYKDQLVFASSRPVPVEKSSGVEWTSDVVNQYYVVLKDPQTDSVYNVKFLRPALHDRGINDAPMAYSADGLEVFITTNNFMDGIRHVSGSGMMLDLYQYKTRSMSEWDKTSERAFPFNAPADKPHSTGFPAFSPDGKSLYFASDRPGGFGGYDLYVCHRSPTGGWSAPQNLGPNINTVGNELCPFIDAEGRLFFASDWHPGMGGMDIFMAEPARSGWTEPYNLGPKVNSSYDELYWVYDAKTKKGYYSSNRPNGQGLEDIYQAYLLGQFPERRAEPVQTGDKIVLSNAIFDGQQDALRPDGQDPEWKRLLKLLDDNPNTLIQINVHTSARGLAKENLTWSRQTARMLAAHLVESGIDAQRILYEGYGEGYPRNACKANINCTEEEHAENHRTEIYFVGLVEPDGALVITYNASPDAKQSTTALAAVVEDPRGSNFKPSPPPNLAQRENKPNNRTTPPSPPTPTPTPSPNTARPIPNPSTNNPQPNPNPSPPPATPAAATTRKQPKSRYKIGDMVELASISYALEKAEVDEKRSEGLEDLVKILKANPYWVLEIASHTDATGSNQHNLNLSQRRAEAVKNYLVKKGVNSGHLIAKGYGETRILNRCKDGVKCSPAEHAVNRRTEFRIIGMKGFKVGDLLDIEEISYEFGKTSLDMKRNAGLQELLTIMKNSSIRIEIGSHTDSQGSDEANLKISEQRAKAIYDYLVSNGISRNRLLAKGYGESQLINHCKDGVNCSEEEHRQNRRTVFKVLGLR